MARHGAYETSNQRPFLCCVVNPMAYRERSTAVVISNHGAGARHSPSAQRNASFAPPTKSFAQAIPESESLKNTSAGQPPVGQPHLPYTTSWQLSPLLQLALGSNICRPAKNSWQLPCQGPGRFVNRPVAETRFSHLSTREKKLATAVLRLVTGTMKPRKQAPFAHLTAMGV